MFSRYEKSRVVRPRNLTLFSERILLFPISLTPGVTIGVDPTGEHINYDDKSRGGLQGITQNENSHIRHYLAVPVLAQPYVGLENNGYHCTRNEVFH